MESARFAAQFVARFSARFAAFFPSKSIWMAAMTGQARLSVSMALLVAGCSPAWATIIPAFSAKLTGEVRAEVARKACLQSAGHATTVRALSFRKGTRTPDFAEVTCAPVRLPSGVVVTATNECELVKDMWKCGTAQRHVERTLAGRTVHLPFDDESEIPARLELAKYLLSLGLYQGYSIWDNVGGSWCGIESAPHGDSVVSCGSIEMSVTDDAKGGPPKYRMFAVEPIPMPIP